VSLLGAGGRHQRVDISRKEDSLLRECHRGSKRRVEGNWLRIVCPTMDAGRLKRERNSRQCSKRGKGGKRETKPRMATSISKLKRRKGRKRPEHRWENEKKSEDGKPENESRERE